MELSTFLWIVGIGIAGGAAYTLMKPQSEKKEFIKHQEAFMPLIRKMSRQFDKNEWSDTVVTVNNKIIYKWWKNLLLENGNSDEKLENTLRVFLKECGITVPTKIIEGEPASTAFVKNRSRFGTILLGLEKGYIDRDKWSEIIVDINNPQLIDVWKKVMNRPDMWMRIIASWGISFDACKKFTYINGREEMYSAPSEGFCEGVAYNVVKSCWIYTSPEGHKEVIIKGIVKKA